MKWKAPPLHPYNYYSEYECGVVAPGTCAGIQIRDIRQQFQFRDYPSMSPLYYTERTTTILTTLKKIGKLKYIVA